MHVYTTHRRVHVDSVAVETSNYCKLWTCVSKLRCPAGNDHLSYCHMWPVRVHIFFCVITQKARFSKKSY